MERQRVQESPSWNQQVWRWMKKMVVPSVQERRALRRQCLSKIDAVSRASWNRWLYAPHVYLTFWKVLITARINKPSTPIQGRCSNSSWALSTQGSTPTKTFRGCKPQFGETSVVHCPGRHLKWATIGFADWEQARWELETRGSPGKSVKVALVGSERLFARQRVVSASEEGGGHMSTLNPFLGLYWSTSPTTEVKNAKFWNLVTGHSTADARRSCCFTVNRIDNTGQQPPAPDLLSLCKVPRKQTRRPWLKLEERAAGSSILRGPGPGTV
ncbi:hypothetical protein EDD85DRAFT_941998 [Armillaria nabsnona]|nr:hypothetical protein EDD85DRAFT_941998 [Armillaria nabsnona]